MPSLRSVLSLCSAAIALLSMLAVIGLTEGFGPSRAERKIVETLRDSALEDARLLERGIAARRREIEMMAIGAAFAGPDFDRDQMRLYLRRSQEATRFFALLGFIGPNGKFLVTSNGLVEGADVSDRDYWKVGRERTYVSDAHDALLLAQSLGAKDATPRFIDISAPVFFGDALLGVLAGHLSTDWINDAGGSLARESTRRLPGVRIDIFDGSGATIFSAADGNGHASPASAPAPGSDDLAAVEPFSGFAQNPDHMWSVRLSAPKATLMAEWNGQRRALLLTGLAVVLAAALFGWSLGAVLSGPIEGAAIDALGLAVGRRPRHRPSRIREFNDVGAALHAAAQELLLVFKQQEKS